MKDAIENLKKFEATGNRKFYLYALVALRANGYSVEMAGFYARDLQIHAASLLKSLGR